MSSARTKLAATITIGALGALGAVAMSSNGGNGGPSEVTAVPAKRTATAAPVEVRTVVVKRTIHRTERAKAPGSQATPAVGAAGRVRGAQAGVATAVPGTQPTTDVDAGRVAARATQGDDSAEPHELEQRESEHSEREDDEREDDDRGELEREEEDDD